ncbi:hypothetical protein QFC22_003818 [Naganishia vaughanmartiniae]|uniref:Uncharacterized protein n=1 Tax=Naganishia vaughanmartiniae TaxID=1424756 RepID=A0ACC2X3J7_9TREE|nr:hypothetical protein QFC22_003818 [Naganishia vaughanmartiniae]
MVFQSPEPLGYGMDSGLGSLPFLGIGFGMILGTITTLFTDKYYVRAVNASSTGSVPPETRLIPACYASWCLPVSLAIFAATSDPSIHWIAPVLAGVPFGLGLIVIFVSVLSYLIDAYAAQVTMGMLDTDMTESSDDGQTPQHDAEQDRL